MKTIKAIIQYIRMPKIFKGAVRQMIETLSKEQLKHNDIKPNVV